MPINQEALAKALANAQRLAQTLTGNKPEEVELLVESFEDVKSLPVFVPVKNKLRDQIEVERDAQNKQAIAVKKQEKADQAEAMMGVILRRAKQAQLNTAAAKEAEAKAWAAATKTAANVESLMSLMDSDLTLLDLDEILGTETPEVEAPKVEAPKVKVAKTTQAPAPSVITQ